jgi:hypothetical protein
MKHNFVSSQELLKSLLKNILDNRLESLERVNSAEIEDLAMLKSGFDAMGVTLRELQLKNTASASELQAENFGTQTQRKNTVTNSTQIPRLNTEVLQNENLEDNAIVRRKSRNNFDSIDSSATQTKTLKNHKTVAHFSKSKPKIGLNSNMFGNEKEDKNNTEKGNYYIYIMILKNFNII